MPFICVTHRCLSLLDGEVPAESSLQLCPLLINPLPVIAGLFCQSWAHAGWHTSREQAKARVWESALRGLWLLVPLKDDERFMAMARVLLDMTIYSSDRLVWS